MKSRSLIIGIVVTLIAGMAGTSSAYSQGTEIDILSRRHAFLGLSIGPSINHLQINDVSMTTTPILTNRSTFNAKIDVGYFFTKSFGISTGIGISNYNTLLELSAFAHAFDTTDAEQEAYERRIAGWEIEEIQKITFFNIPVQFMLQLPLGRSVGFFINSGINLNLPVVTSYNSQGTFSYSGFYPAHNVLISDIGYEGFQNNVANDVTGELKLKRINPEFISSAGFQFMLQKRFQFSIGFYYSRWLTDVSEYESEGSFRLSTQPDKMKSMMESGGSVVASTMGSRIGLRYYLN